MQCTGRGQHGTLYNPVSLSMTWCRGQRTSGDADRLRQVLVDVALQPSGALRAVCTGASTRCERGASNRRSTPLQLVLNDADVGGHAHGGCQLHGRHKAIGPRSAATVSYRLTYGAVSTCRGGSGTGVTAAELGLGAARHAVGALCRAVFAPNLNGLA